MCYRYDEMTYLNRTLIEHDFASMLCCVAATGSARDERSGAGGSTAPRWCLDAGGFLGNGGRCVHLKEFFAHARYRVQGTREVQVYT